MPDTRFAKLLRKLRCPRSAPAAPHEAGRLRQEKTLRPRVLSQCRRRMSHTLCPCQFRFRSPTRCSFVTRFTVPLSSSAPQCMRTRQCRCHAFPPLVLFTPFLKWCDDVWPSFSSFRLEDEATVAAVDGSACFDSC